MRPTPIHPPFHLLLALAATCAAGWAEDVVVVQSYHQGYAWTDALDVGLRRAWAGRDLRTRTIYMDTKRRPDGTAMAAAGEHALAAIAATAPTVVIAADDNAQTFVGRHLVGRTDLALVFCGVNEDHARYGYAGAANVTGILERPHAAESITLLRQLVPGVRRLALLSDDTETARSALALIRTALPEDVAITACVHAGTMAEWQAAVSAAHGQADALGIYTYESLRGDDGTVLPPATVMAWTREHLQLPSVAFLDWPVRDGLLCAVAESPQEHGYLAGRAALEILDGRRAGAIPVTTARTGTVMLNLGTAQRLGISVPDAVAEMLDVVVK